MSQTGAKIIAEKLSQVGCKRAFGIPGGEVLAVMGALDEAGIEFHLSKHENPAGFMAEGSWHAEEPGSRAPGILVATIGPGVANAVNVVANAHQDRVPLIFLTGCVDADEAETYTHQVFDHQAMLKEIVKASFRATSGTLSVMMDKALAIAVDGQPGPVHIDVPISVAESPSEEIISPLAPLPTPALPSAEGPLSEAARAISNAKTPLVVAGVDAVNEHASKELETFCTQHQIPLVTTYKAKGMVDERNELVLGGAGLSPKADKILMPLIAQSDCIILAGYDPIEMRTGWRNPWNDAATVIDITPVMRTHGMHRTDIILRGSCGGILDGLTSAVTSQNYWASGEPAKARDLLKSAFAPAAEFGPGQVFATLNQCLPDDTVITIDSGAHRILLSQMWQSTQPRSILQSTALCTMGCALPLATGYKMARPDRPVCAFTGDAGLEMILGELATLKETGLPVIVTVLVDESLALIEMKQRSSQRPNVGVDFGGTDFVGVANAMGGTGVWIDDTQTLKAEAQAALSRDHFTLLACRIGRRAYDGTF